jgi:hypothetical protein
VDVVDVGGVEWEGHRGSIWWDGVFTFTASAYTATCFSPPARADSCPHRPTNSSLFRPKPHAPPLVPSRERSPRPRSKRGVRENNVAETLPTSRPLHLIVATTLSGGDLNLAYVDLRPISQRHDRDFRSINGFVTFSTVDVFLVTVTPAGDFGCHEMFIDLFLTRRIYGARITATVRVLERMGLFRSGGNRQRFSGTYHLKFHGGVEV